MSFLTMIAGLKIIGGNPLMKVKKVIGEFLPLTKSLDGGGGMKDLLGKVMGGDISSVLPNITGQLTGQLQGIVGQGLGSLSALNSVIPGADGLAGSIQQFAPQLQSALGDFQGMVGNLQSAAGGLLSGDGIMNLMGHANVLGQAGDVLGNVASMANAIAPISIDSHVQSAMSSIPGMVQDVISGKMTESAAVAMVQGWHGTYQDAISRSTAAFAAGDTAVMGLATVNAIAGYMVAADDNDPLRALMLQRVPDDVMETMKTSLETHVQEYPDAVANLRARLAR